MLAIGLRSSIIMPGPAKRNSMIAPGPLKRNSLTAPGSVKRKKKKAEVSEIIYEDSSEDSA